MHFSDASPSSRAGAVTGAWWKELTRYQWFVFIVASLGWLFDTMDQQLFNLARKSGRHASLLHIEPGDRRDRRQVDEYAGYATIDLHDRLGAGRDLLRHPGRPDRPRQDDDPDDPVLLGLHRA